MAAVQIFGVDAWLFWFLIAMVLLGVEMIVAGVLYFGAVAPAALGASLVAALDGSAELQVLTLAVVAGLSLVFVRPFARQHLIIEDKVKVGPELLVGKRALVTSEVTVDSGTVVVEGQSWSARIDDENGRIEAGTRVTVREFRGVAAIVERDAS